MVLIRRHSVSNSGEIIGYWTPSKIQVKALIWCCQKFIVSTIEILLVSAIQNNMIGISPGRFESEAGTHLQPDETVGESCIMIATTVAMGCGLCGARADKNRLDPMAGMAKQLTAHLR